MKNRIVGGVCFLVMFLTLIAGTAFLQNAFDKKDNYNPTKHINAYVVGDAYNYAINGSYFAGYAALAGCMFICATVSGCSGFYFLLKKGASTQTNGRGHYIDRELEA